MSKSLLKGLAVTFGAGLAFGIGTKLGRNSAPRRPPILDLDPLMDRLDGVEDRIQKVEIGFSAAPFRTAQPDRTEQAAPHILDESLGEMYARLSAQTLDLHQLRQEIQTVESRSAEQVAAFSRKLSEVEARLPTEIEAHVGARIAALEQKLQADFRQTHSRTVEMFVETIESKVVHRIAALEQSLAEHSNTIVSLREKSLSTDENLQKLLAAVEKLCAQTAARIDPPAKFPDLPPPSHGSSESPKSVAAHMEREPGRGPAQPQAHSAAHSPSAEIKRNSTPLVFTIVAVSLGLLGIRLSR